MAYLSISLTVYFSSFHFSFNHLKKRKIFFAILFGIKYFGNHKQCDTKNFKSINLRICYLKKLSFNPFHSNKIASKFSLKFLYVQHFLSNSKKLSFALSRKLRSLTLTYLNFFLEPTPVFTPPQILCSPHLSLVSCTEVALFILWKAHYSSHMSSPSLSDF